MMKKALNWLDTARKDTVIWVDERLPIFTFIDKHLVSYETPKNLNYLWNFGSLAGVTLMIMIITGLFLAMHYKPDINYAFDSVETIMREVNYGWLIRYIHMNGASMFFILVYIHILRSLYYGSYKEPRELLWLTGIVIFILMMATAFMGYVLPWGQMSYWGATVITNLFSAFPFGESIVQWLWGGFSVGDPTLNRFFILHFLLPFLLIGIVFIHLMALHQFGSNNPLGAEKEKVGTVPFHPFYTVKDLFGLGLFFIIWLGFVFFAPHFFGEPENFIPADPLVTPEHIVPEWYFLPFYAILRAIPSKLGGVVMMFMAIGVLAFLPWIDRSPVRSGRFRPIYKILFWLFVANCLVLGWIGSQPAEGIMVALGRICTGYYFLHFFVLIPLSVHFERGLKVPEYALISSKKKV